MILTTDKVITTIIKVISSTTKVIFATDLRNVSELNGTAHGAFRAEKNLLSKTISKEMKKMLNFEKLHFVTYLQYPKYPSWIKS